MGSCDSQKKTAPNPASHPSIPGASNLDCIPLYSAYRSLRALRSCFRPSMPRLCAALPLLLHGGAVCGPQTGGAYEAVSGKRGSAQRQFDNVRREENRNPAGFGKRLFFWTSKARFLFAREKKMGFGKSFPSVREILGTRCKNPFSFVPGKRKRVLATPKRKPPRILRVTLLFPAHET